jgi:hypothetical protein
MNEADGRSFDPPERLNTAEPVCHSKKVACLRSPREQITTAEPYCASPVGAWASIRLSGTPRLASEGLPGGDFDPLKRRH